MWELEDIKEMRNQQEFAMDLVGKLKTIKNEKLILKDKINQQERHLRFMKQKEAREEIMRREIFESQKDQAKENGVLVARLEEMNELVEAKNKKIKKMSKEVKRIQELVGNQKSEVAEVIEQKKEEIVEVLKMNKQLNEAKKKSKEKKKEKKKEIENIVEQYEERKQQYKELEHENEKLKQNCKELEERLQKMYEDNSLLFQENNKIKEIIAQFKQNEGSHYQLMEDNAIIRKQLDEERIINQKNLEQMTHKVSFLQQQEHIKIVQQLKTDQAQMQKLQEKFRINENNYEAQVNQLQFTLNKIQNDNLHIQAHGQHSFETLLRDFEQIQLHNQFLVEQLKEYECKFANLLLMQESFMGNQQCCLPNQSMQLLPIQTNIYTSPPPPPQIILNKPHTPNYQTALQRTPQIRSSAPPYQMNSKDDRLNKKIYQRCREIVTQYD